MEYYFYKCFFVENHYTWMLRRLYSSNGCERSKLKSFRGGGTHALSYCATTGSRCESSSSGMVKEPGSNVSCGWWSETSPGSMTNPSIVD